MSEVNEQRVCIKFCLKLGKNATETYEMIKTAFGDDSLSRSKIFEWFKRFKNGRETTEDDPRSGRPSTSRNDDVVSKICEKVRNDRRLTVRELADEAGISIGSCHEILTENLQMRRVAAKFVPRLLTLEQKENRLTICQDLKNRSIDPNFIKNIVTGDETWVYGYDPETKAQSSQWKTKFSPRPKKARQVRSSVKTMLIVFFDIEGIVHYEFVPHGQTVNQVFYKDVLMRLREKIRKKRPEKWRTETWFLHHDNAPAHSALSIREFLADKKIPVVPHPPYSPDLAPCDFFLFPKLKFALKGQRFQDVEEIKANTAAELKVLTSEQFQRTFEKWQDRWNHCILSGGEYFEGSGREWTRVLIPPDLLSRWVNRSHGEMSFHLTQLMTGHGCFNWFLQRINRYPSVRCSHCGSSDGYGEAVDKAHHTLFRCEAFRRERERLVDTIGPFDPGGLIPRMLESPAHWEAIFDFAREVMTAKESAERDRQFRQGWLRRGVDDDDGDVGGAVYGPPA
ncbi:hypothetical protein QTP88_021396 [Uroleucon formosanum]